jgi:flavin reductase (DIM6/NTAB) family NADH-FMN oxidoreductase RutF
MDPTTKKRALRLLTNGLYILTSRAGKQVGVATVTWVSQASFKPPLVMAAVRKGSNVFRCLEESRSAALHILAADQQALAQKFFSTTKPLGETLNGEPYVEGKTGAPILKHVSTYIECRVVDIRGEYGDHAVVVMEVVAASSPENFKPLTVADSPWEYGG